VAILVQIQNTEYTLDQKAIVKLLLYGAVLTALAIIALAALVFVVSFAFHMVFSLLLTACVEADRAGWLTQTLLLLVVGFVLYRGFKFALRAARAFLAW
jgi:hypothetical protein